MAVGGVDPRGLGGLLGQPGNKHGQQADAEDRAGLLRVLAF